MATQASQKPAIVIEPDVEPFMDDDMKRIREIQLRTAIDIADAQGVSIERIRSRLFRSPEEYDWHVVIFEILVDADDDTGYPYWEAVVNAVFEAADTELNATQKDLLRDHVAEFVEWL